MVSTSEKILHPPAFPSSRLSPQVHTLSSLSQASNVVSEKRTSLQSSPSSRMSPGAPGLLQVPLTTSSTYIHQELGDFNKGRKKISHPILELQALRQLVRGDIWGQRK